jgi:hypothetical protein
MSETTAPVPTVSKKVGGGDELLTFLLCVAKLVVNYDQLSQKKVSFTPENKQQINATCVVLKDLSMHLRLVTVDLKRVKHVLDVLSLKLQIFEMWKPLAARYLNLTEEKAGAFYVANIQPLGQIEALREGKVESSIAMRYLLELRYAGTFLTLQPPVPLLLAWARRRLHQQP